MESNFETHCYHRGLTRDGHPASHVWYRPIMSDLGDKPFQASLSTKLPRTSPDKHSLEDWFFPDLFPMHPYRKVTQPLSAMSA